jgi:hypothetical protein
MVRVYPDWGLSRTFFVPRHRRRAGCAAGVSSCHSCQRRQPAGRGDLEVFPASGQLGRGDLASGPLAGDRHRRMKCLLISAPRSCWSPAARAACNPVRSWSSPPLAVPAVLLLAPLILTKLRCGLVHVLSSLVDLLREFLGPNDPLHQPPTPKLEFGRVGISCIRPLQDQLEPAIGSLHLQAAWLGKHWRRFQQTAQPAGRRRGTCMQTWATSPARRRPIEPGRAALTWAAACWPPTMSHRRRPPHHSCRCIYPRLLPPRMECPLISAPRSCWSPAARAACNPRQR